MADSTHTRFRQRPWICPILRPFGYKLATEIVVAKEAMRTRKRQLAERLKEQRDWTDIRDDAASMLGRLLRQDEVET